VKLDVDIFNVNENEVPPEEKKSNYRGSGNLDI